MAQREIVKFGRQNLVVTFTPTFVFPTTEEVQKSTLENSNENDWVSPMQLQSFSGIKINISGEGKGTSANIEIGKMDGVIRRSEVALGRFYGGLDIESSSVDNSPLSALNIKVNYLPRDMSADKGASALQLAEKYAYEQVVNAANNLRCEGKFAEANARQKNALMAAASLMLLKNNSPKGFTDALAKDLSGTMNQCINNPSMQNLVGIVSTLEQNNPGLIAEYFSQGDVSSGQSIITIYDCPTKTPKITKVDSQGYTKVYSFKITIDIEKKYPVHVQIDEGKGKPQQNRAVGIQTGSYKKVVSKSFDFTADEWLYALNMCKEFRAATVVCELNRISQNAENQRQISMQKTQAKQQNAGNQPQQGYPQQGYMPQSNPQQGYVQQYIA